MAHMIYHVCHITNVALLWLIYMLNFENVIDGSLQVVNFQIMSNMSYLRSKFFL